MFGNDRIRNRMNFRSTKGVSQKRTRVPVLILVWSTIIGLSNFLLIDAFVNPSSFRIQAQLISSDSINSKSIKTPFKNRRSPPKCLFSLDDDFQVPRSVAVIENESSLGKIYLIGCLHGAPSSKEDVEHVISRTNPGSVVLELCDSRYKSLSKEVQDEDADLLPTDMRFFVDRWAKGVVVTFQKKGPVEALIGGFLSSTYLAQKLSRFDPGSEFKQVLRMSRTYDFEVINGDQDVYKTLGRFGGGFKMESLKNTTVASAKEDFQMLGQALFGSDGKAWPESLNVFQVLFLQPRLVRDLVLLLTPITIIVYALTDGTGFVIEEALGLHNAQAEPGTSQWFEVLTDVLNYITLAFSLVFTSKFFRLIIGERNEFLANSISEVYARNPDKDVVAVLGLLHCNGIAELLRQRQKLDDRQD